MNATLPPDVATVLLQQAQDGFPHVEHYVTTNDAINAARHNYRTTLEAYLDLAEWAQAAAAQHPDLPPPPWVKTWTG